MTSIDFTKTSTYANLCHYWTSEDYELNGIDHELNYCQPMSRGSSSRFLSVGWRVVRLPPLLWLSPSLCELLDLLGGERLGRVVVLFIGLVEDIFVVYGMAFVVYGLVAVDWLAVVRTDLVTTIAAAATAQPANQPKGTSMKNHGTWAEYVKSLADEYTGMKVRTISE